MSAWTILGLQRTDDIAEIRRAYAGKLKAIDVDSDPAAFIALREAFNRARAEAEARGYCRQPAIEEEDRAPQAVSTPEPPPTDSPHTPEPEPKAGGYQYEPAIEQDDAPYVVASEAPQPAAPISVPEPEIAAGDDPDARFIALGNLLFPGEGAPPPDPDALTDAVRAVLAHQEMEQVDRSANVEFWLARLLYDSAPNSDPVIPMVIEHFHWDRKAGHWDQPELFEALLQRRNAFRLLDQIAYRGHPLHAAWRDLTSDKPTIGLTPPGRRSDVASLLYKIRAEAPPAEAYLNPHRIALWEGLVGDTGGGRTGTGLNWIWIAVIALVALGKLGSAINGPSTPSSSPALHYTLTDPSVDLNPILSGVAGNETDLVGLSTRNPRLHALLVDAWGQARDRGDSGMNLEVEVRALLDNFYLDSIRAAPASMQADYWRIRIDQSKWLRERGARTCVRAIQSIDTADRYGFPQELEDRLRALRLNIWTEVGVEPPPRRAAIVVPGRIAAAAASSANLDLSAFNLAMRGNGTPETICAAQIALAETALTRPPAESERLIRDLTSLE